MTINFNYDKKFTENYVKAQIDNEADIDVMNVSFKGFTFMKQLLQNYPELFDNNASQLFYIECGGKTVNSNFLYLVFENMITNSNNAIVKAKLNNIPLYTVNQDPYIQWARYLQATSTFPIYEPVMCVCNQALKQFIDNGKLFDYKNVRLSISNIKPLCVSNIGENVSDLILHIAYIYNFFINCNPFKFNEVLTGSSTQLFMEAINNHINVFFTKLIEEGIYVAKDGETISNSFKFNSLDQLYSEVSNITYFKQDDVKKLISKILNFNRIQEIRNNIAKTLNSMEQNVITNQNVIQLETCYDGYVSVLSNLIDIVIKNNYFYKNILSNFPHFCNNNVDYYELSLLTSYALSGGKSPFIINDNEQYEGICDVGSLHSYPDIGKQELLTNINKPTIVGYKPFISSNVFLDIITGYVAEKFDNYQNDTLCNKPIGVDEADLKTTKIRIDKILNNLYLNGKFNLYSESISTSLEYLTKNTNLSTQWKSILYLANLCSVLYDNKFGARMLPAYILSFYPEYLLSYMKGNKKWRTLSKFDYITYFCLHHHKLNECRVNKLYNMLMSILFLNNDRYIDFVNSQASIITKILTTGAIITQPYIKSIADKIDVLCIGGVSLGAKSIDTNPLTRGYYFVVSTQGNCEKLKLFYEFAKRITNNQTFELINTALKTNSTDSIRDNINQAAATLFYNNNLPTQLANFKIDKENGTYTTYDYNVYININTSNNIPIYKLISTYIFPVINANNSQYPTFYSRNIYISNTTSRPIENKIKFDKAEYNCSSVDRGTTYNIPVYDFATSFNNVNLSFIQPSGYKLLQIYTSNSELPKNNLFFVFTNNNIAFLEDKYPVFNVFDTIASEMTNNTNTNMFTTSISTTHEADRKLNNIPPQRDNTFKTNRIKLNGINKQPIPRT